MKKNFIGTVIKVDSRGHSGPYALARCDELTGTIRFPLDPGKWLEPMDPEEGMRVELEDVYDTKHGWRARTAKLIRPSTNEQKQHSREVVS